MNARARSNYRASHQIWGIQLNFVNAEMFYMLASYNYEYFMNFNVAFMLRNVERIGESVLFYFEITYM